MMLLPQLARWERQVFSVERGIVRWHRIRERLADGAVYRTFWFEDRDDADQFLWAAVTGSLIYEHDLWKLPTPYWEPPGIDVVYDFVTIVTLSGVGLQTWTTASDFNAGNNFIDAIGAGGSGANCSFANGAASGGAGGSWARINNAPLVPGVGAAANVPGGPAGPVGTAGNNGSAGGDAWMRVDGVSANPGTVAQGVRGGGGGFGQQLVSGTASAGAPGPSVGTLINAGGSGGVARCTSGASAGGGGGAGGPGGVGSTPASPLNSWSAGGACPGGGAGGATERANGVAGTNMGTGAFGSGGGGAGSMTTASTGGSGALVGGGGAGSAWNTTGVTTRAGSGGQGMIWITYTPGIAGFNMPMMGI